ncbi:MAG: 30S ribosomal protein S18 [Candidatus Curtissbacteria bacterium]|nr:30S ribosomal protein S18 [Candidatus Curtissbacteria bacterium]
MQKFIKKQRKAKNCPLCATNTTIDYKDGVLLRRFISERGKIQGRARTGVCAKHQRQVTRGVKLARHMAILPFVQS